MFKVASTKETLPSNMITKLKYPLNQLNSIKAQIQRENIKVHLKENQILINNSIKLHKATIQYLLIRILETIIFPSLPR